MKQQYVAVKVLSRDFTTAALSEQKTTLELDVMRKIREGCECDTLPHLRDIFEIYGHEKPVHICMVMDVYGLDLGSFRRSSPNRALPFYTVKVIMKQVVDALVNLHEINIIHTGMLHFPQFAPLVTQFFPRRETR